MSNWDSEYERTVASQPVTESDRNSEVLRIPGSALTAFPITPEVVTISVNGAERSVLWSPRSNDRRSGTLAVGIDIMSALPVSEPVRIGVKDGVFHLQPALLAA
ncbi:hypothetical protein RBS60_17035 [Sinomonas sp. ASV486]|uniref:Uncharacterized protein n=1 Tax=Sinomonas puerhi TaxID=3238584 RepID=A0AB39L5Z2_9MICC|nr:hypothetical protein [Sinomonas sp. ASV486]MDQ4491907.1 hypothetical protein [Sinomonas sp. ASV486]